MQHSSQVPTPDGRVLQVHAGGDPAGRTVVFHHGTPAGGLLYERDDALTATLGLRLIGYDRPGYGGSTRHRGRTVADAAADVLTILDALGVERFATWGMSGGGPHALACAALAPERCAVAVTVAGVAPFDAPGLDWLGTSRGPTCTSARPMDTCPCWTRRFRPSTPPWLATLSEVGIPTDVQVNSP